MLGTMCFWFWGDDDPRRFGASGTSLHFNVLSHSVFKRGRLWCSIARSLPLKQHLATFRELKGQFTRARQWGKLKSQNPEGFGVFRVRGRVLEGFWRASGGLRLLGGSWRASGTWLGAGRAL